MLAGLGLCHHAREGKRKDLHRIAIPTRAVPPLWNRLSTARRTGIRQGLPAVNSRSALDDPDTTDRFHAGKNPLLCCEDGLFGRRQYELRLGHQRHQFPALEGYSRLPHHRRSAAMNRRALAVYVRTG